QNAADAAALAAATALAFDSAADTNIADAAARKTAEENPVLGQIAVAEVETSPFGCTVSGMPDAVPFVPTCTTVSVYRNTANGNELPVFFGPLIGVTSQNIQAQAQASMSPANATSCLWPLAIPDRWAEANEAGAFSPALTFTKFDQATGTAL